MTAYIGNRRPVSAVIALIAKIIIPIPLIIQIKIAHRTSI